MIYTFAHDFKIWVYLYMSRVSCQKGPTRHAYAWQLRPFWQDALDVYYKHVSCIRQTRNGLSLSLQISYTT